ncbi:unnamed protein product, partial [Coregonus sp. 'balchen']
MEGRTGIGRDRDMEGRMDREGQYAVIAFGCASCPKITCGREGCGTEFCYHCKQLWHPNQTCDAARQQRAQSLRLRTFSSSSLSYSQESGVAADDIKPCPRCAAYIIKMNDGSCNHMTCAVCGCEFCWLCMKEISDLHYLSPSGCTFWGRKPWSRKKKILWQLGTLVGAPVGIALIAGIAIPAMIIGIPVYVGRKIHNRYEGKDISPHRRNLVIAGGVTLSVFMSPVVAAVSVGCGVSAGNGKGVRIEFDDENEMNVRSGAQATDTTSVADTRNNPSIGEGSVGGMTSSLSASGSHVDRMGAMRDNLSWRCRLMFRRRGVVSVESQPPSAWGQSVTTLAPKQWLDPFSTTDGTSMEVQVDVEPGKSGGKLRYHSGTSRMDDGRHAGRCSWSCPSGCPSEGQDGTTKSKLKKEGGSKTQERREDMDARLLEQHSTNSSEFDSSLSGSLPSVADSHSSHLSEFSGGSDLESMKMSCSCSHGSPSDYHARFTTVSPLPEVEGDRLETLPSPQGVLSHPHSPTSPCSCLEVSVSPLCLIAEENINQVCPAKAEWDSTSGGELPIGELLKENNYNLQAPPPSLLQNSCIQMQAPPPSLLQNSCIQTEI